MNKSIIFVFVAFLAHNFSIAQIDQVSVGASYSQQAYYTLSTGEFEVVANDAWDIAFSNAGDTDGGIFINESATFMTSGILLFETSTTDWSEDIDDSTLFPDSIAIYNDELSWTEGAFNLVKELSDPFDYGWGSYNMTSHVIEGTRIFVIKKRDGNFIKFMVDDLTDGVYSFRYANLDGSNEVINSVSKLDAGEAPLIYFSFETNDLVDIPSDYDLIFTRYTDELDAGNGEFIQYTVTGVLLAPGAQAVVANEIDIETVDFADYENDFSEVPNTIGHDWKSFDFTVGWEVDLERAQFIKTKEGEIYKVIFFDFEGSSTGIITFEKTLIGTSSIADLKHENFVNIFPNPFKDYISLASDQESNLYRIELFNEIGNLIFKASVRSNERINLPSNLFDGAYFLRIQDELNRVQTVKLIK